jgi:hypothetical protein
MPKTSGAVLDWVPQKAAQQMQSEATMRFIPIPPRLSRGDAAQRARQVVPRATSSIHWRDAVKFARTAKAGCARPARGDRAPSMMVA